MKNIVDFPRIKGFRFPRSIISYAVWAYHRFNLSTADVKDLLAGCCVTVSREAFRLWVNRFGTSFANCIRRDQPRPRDKWHLDEGVIPITGVKYWRWRAIDADGDVLDIAGATPQEREGCKAVFQRADWPIWAARGHNN